MTTDQILATIEPVLAKCDFKASVDGGVIKIWNKKRVQAGHLSADGEVFERRLGQQNVLGALLKRQLVEALEAASGEKAGSLTPRENAIAQIRAAMAEHGISPSDLLETR